MALIWADNFQMYGQAAQLTNGVYASINGVNLVNGVNESYLYFGDTHSSDRGRIRFVLPAGRAVVGQGGFMYLTNLPTGNSQIPAPITWKNASNSFLYCVCVLPTGQIEVRRGGLGGTALATTPSPVITANASTHIEAKLKIHETEGSIEVRVRGRTVIQLEELNTGSVAIAQVEVNNEPSPISVSAPYEWRHWTLWDDLGEVNNDFLGQVMVYWNEGIRTLTNGGWLSSAGADAHETLDKPRLGNQLTLSGNIANNETIRIQNTYYRWTNGDVTAGAGTSANPWLVKLGVTNVESLENMYKAINATGVAGVTYSTALIANPVAEAFGIIEDAFCVIPRVEGTTTMTFAETGAALAWASTSAFTHRVWDPIRMVAGYVPAVRATGSLTFTGIPVENETVTIGDQVYTFKTSPTLPLEVGIGTTLEQSVELLSDVINSQSTYVTSEVVVDQLDLEARSSGIVGNTYALATTATGITLSGATLAGGEEIEYPDDFVIGLTPLPDDVTSIRAVIPVVRAAKLDGGDGNIQVSFGTLNTNYDVGPDTPLTNAMTYWGNATEPFVSEINPDTGTPWTPGEFNLGARIRVARTK